MRHMSPISRMALDRSLSRRIVRSPRMALDKVSVRRIDQDGHLHVASSIISAAQVNPYTGREVDPSGEFGFLPDRVYQIFRDPAELAKAAPTFQGKPLTIQHRSQTANDHAANIVVGSVNDPQWKPPNLTAALTIWDGDAIQMVQDGSQAALSCGYRFDLDPTPGIWLGKRYDARFINLRGNHISLVPDGRVEGALVSDASLLKRKKTMSESDGGDDLYKDLMEFLHDKLTAKDLMVVKKMCCGDDADSDDDDDDAAARVAADRAMSARQSSRQSPAQRAEFLERFPNANRLR